jgi:hypothetical protein
VRGKGNVYRRLENLEARAPAPAQLRYSEHRQKMLVDLDRLAAWRRAGSPDTEEGGELQAFAEAVRRRGAEMRGEGTSYKRL